MEIQLHHMMETIIDEVGEEQAYKDYQIFAAYGMGKLDLEDLDEDYRRDLFRMKWTRETCARFGDALEKALTARGYIEEVGE